MISQSHLIQRVVYDSESLVPMVMPVLTKTDPQDFLPAKNRQ